MSVRMGKPKQLMDWQGRPMVRHVCEALLAGGAKRVLVVTGNESASVAEAVRDCPAAAIFNPDFATGDMMQSIKAGLRAVVADAALIALADQPHIETQTVRVVIGHWLSTQADFVAPSYEGRRGHPLLVSRTAFDDLLALPPTATLRSFLNNNPLRVDYVVVSSDSILRDVDTPDDYARAKSDLSPRA